VPRFAAVRRSVLQCLAVRGKEIVDDNVCLQTCMHNTCIIHAKYIIIHTTGVKIIQISHESSFPSMYSSTYISVII